MGALREDDSNRVRASLRALVPVTLAVAIFEGYGLVSDWLFQGQSSELSGPEFLVYGCLMGLTYLAMIVVPIVAARRLERSAYAEFGLGIDRGWLRTFVAGIGISVLAVSLSWWWGALRGIRSLDLAAGGIRSLDGPLLVGAVLLVTVGYLFLGYVYEEVVFRRIMIDNLAEGLSARGLSPRSAVGLATVLSLAAFGLVHYVYRGNLLVVVDSALTGTMFAFAFLLTGELALPIGVHAGRYVVDVFAGGSYGSVEVLGIGAITRDTLPANLEVRFVQIAVVCLLASIWVYRQRGSVGIPAAVYQRDTHQSPAD
jgi:hypothetical protein